MENTTVDIQMPEKSKQQKLAVNINIICCYEK